MHHAIEPWMAQVRECFCVFFVDSPPCQVRVVRFYVSCPSPQYIIFVGRKSAGFSLGHGHYFTNEHTFKFACFW